MADKTSLTLDAMKDIAEQYANGNISKFVRDLIWAYHKEQLKTGQTTKQDNRLFLLQNLSFLLLGITFVILSLSLFVDIFVVINISFMIISSFFLFVYVFISVKRQVRIIQLRMKGG